MAWGKSIFMFFGNIGNSLHHQIPLNWSSGLQIGPRIFWEAMTPNKTHYFPRNDQKKKRELGQLPQIVIFFQNGFLFLFFFSPSWPGSHWTALGPNGPQNRKTEKNGFSAKQKYVAPYGDSGRFGVTEWSGNIFCVEIDRGLQFSVSPNSGFLENR